jgi:hypothetical protein
MNGRIIVLAGLAAATSFVPANAQTLAGKFRGQYVCEKLPATPDILRVPIDLAVDGNKVRFARPLFNANGTRVVGSEMAAGTIDANGQVHLTSQWSFLGFTADGQYSGTLTPAGGTLTGTQTWSGPVGNPVSRTCTAALVPAPKSAPAANPAESDDAVEGEHP